MSLRHALSLAVAIFSLAGASSFAADLATLGSQPLGAGETFRPVSEGRLAVAASKLREAIGPLDRLLARSASGENWKTYLDWPALQQQAASGSHADITTLKRLYGRLDSGENGLEMPQFAAVRRAVGSVTTMRLKAASASPHSAVPWNRATARGSWSWHR